MHIIFQNNQYLGSYYFTRSADDPVWRKCFSTKLCFGHESSQLNWKVPSPSVTRSYSASVLFVVINDNFSAGLRWHFSGGAYLDIRPRYHLKTSLHNFQFVAPQKLCTGHSQEADWVNGDPALFSRFKSRHSNELKALKHLDRYV